MDDRSKQVLDPFLSRGELVRHRNEALRKLKQLEEMMMMWAHLIVLNWPSECDAAMGCNMRQWIKDCETGMVNEKKKPYRNS